MTITDTSKNRVLVSAGKITISGNNATAVDADEKEIKDGAVIANGETITLTITDTVKITANGEEEIVTETGTETLTVNGDIKVEDWETQEEFEANVAEAIEENVKTNAANKVTIDEKSNTVTVTVNSLTASGTGLMDLVKTLVDAGYDVTVEHNGYEYVLKGDTSADKATLSKLVVAGARTTLTVTISSDMAEDDIVYTVNVDASELTVAAG